MFSQPLINFKSQFSQTEEVDSYDNIALNQRDMVTVSLSPLYGVTKSFVFH